MKHVCFSELQPGMRVCRQSSAGLEICDICAVAGASVTLSRPCGREEFNSSGFNADADAFLQRDSVGFVVLPMTLDEVQVGDTVARYLPICTVPSETLRVTARADTIVCTARRTVADLDALHRQRGLRRLACIASDEFTRSVMENGELPITLVFDLRGRELDPLNLRDGRVGSCIVPVGGPPPAPALFNYDNL